MKSVAKFAYYSLLLSLTIYVFKKLKFHTASVYSMFVSLVLCFWVQTNKADLFLHLVLDRCVDIFGGKFSQSRTCICDKQQNHVTHTFIYSVRKRVELVKIHK